MDDRINARLMAFSLMKDIRALTYNTIPQTPYTHTIPTHHTSHTCYQQLRLHHVFGLSTASESWK